MQTAFNLRLFKPEDLKRAVYINRTCLNSDLFFADLNEGLPTKFIVAEENGQVVGYAVCRIERGILHSKIIGLTRRIGHAVSHIDRRISVFKIIRFAQKVARYVMSYIERKIPVFRMIGFPKVGHLISLAVLPKYQNRGIGYALMREVVQTAFLCNAVECLLEVRVSNTPAINLYRKMGFTISGKKRGFFADGEDAYTMTRKTFVTNH